MTEKVKDAILRVFPQGTSLEAEADAKRLAPGVPPVITNCPIWPPDIFAVTGYLLYNSAAYHHVIAGEDAIRAPDGSVVFKKSDIERFRRIGKSWSQTPSLPDPVAKLWAELIERSDVEDLCKVEDNGHRRARWWRAAYSLMAIADEACTDVGYLPGAEADRRKLWVVRMANNILTDRSTHSNPASRHLKRVRNACTIAWPGVDPDVVCVLPKARTPDVGCSLRNLSHNLALLPPRGVMRVHWQTAPVIQPVDNSQLNLLLVPFPYSLDAACFRADLVSSTDAKAPWGWFHLHQGWLKAGDPGLVTDLVEALLRRAEDSGEQIHGIVFPEYSLSYEVYEALASQLRDNHPSVQFLVAGSSSNCGGHKGNFALASHFFDDADDVGSDDSSRMMATVSRAKHHRWSLDKSQIQGYGLEGIFDPVHSNARWWEHIPLTARELHVNAMREASVFTVMICEDLARSDPIHEPLRAIGPNLVFVLLMDGPQEAWRWASRYSTGLAEDPGSSVLAFTSRALVERKNNTLDPSKHCWSVGIWKDEAHIACPIDCMPGYEAIILKLQGKRQTEQTIDGRDNTQTFAWHLLGHPKPLSLDRVADAGILMRLGIKH